MKPVNNQETLNTVITHLSQVLEIIGYDAENAERFTKEFLLIVDTKVLEKVYRRMDSTNKSNFEQFIKETQKIEMNSGNVEEHMTTYLDSVQKYIKETVGQSEFQILYIETLEDLYEDYLSTVMEKTTHEQTDKIMLISNTL